MDIVIEDYIKAERNIDLQKVVESKLNDFKLPSLNTFKPNIQEYLIRIETIVQSWEVLRNEYLSRYIKTKVNASSIAGKIGISRQTIYNNRDILEVYINKSQEIQESHDVFAEKNQLRETINYLNKDIDNLELRDVKMEILKIDYENVMKERDDAYKQVDNLSKQIGDLYKKIESLEKLVSNKKVLPINKK